MAAESNDPEARKKPKPSEIKKKKKKKKKEEKEKPVKKMKPGNDIDNIFEELQKKKRKAKPDNEIDEIFDSTQKKKKMKKEEEEGKKEKRDKLWVSPIHKSGDRERKKPRRRTGDGLPIYSADELGVSNPNAGGTPLCPFDCSCCF